MGYICIFLGISLVLSFYWIQKVKKRYQNLIKLQKNTQLKFLKAQIQPHFFFNSLNQLYALSLKESKDLPSFIMRISQMMQYVTYDAHKPLVNIKKDLNYLKDFIDFQALKFKDTLCCFSVHMPEFKNAKIPPLLFLPFIENSFKHGGDKSSFQLNIRFREIKNHNIVTVISNNYKPSKIQGNGIGLTNTEKKLSLIFGNKYHLKIKKTEYWYTIILVIPFNKIT